MNPTTFAAIVGIFWFAALFWTVYDISRT